MERFAGPEGTRVTVEPQQPRIEIPGIPPIVGPALVITNPGGGERPQVGEGPQLGEEEDLVD